MHVMRLRVPMVEAALVAAAVLGAVPFAACSRLPFHSHTVKLRGISSFGQAKASSALSMSVRRDIKRERSSPDSACWLKSFSINLSSPYQRFRRLSKAQRR